MGKNLADKIPQNGEEDDILDVRNRENQNFAFNVIILEDLNKELKAIDEEKSSGFDHLSAKYSIIEVTNWASKKWHELKSSVNRVR